MPHELPQGPWEKLPIDFFEFCGLRVIPFSSATSRFYPALTVIRSAKTGLRNASSFYDPSASKSKEIKASYVLIWAGKVRRTHIKSLDLSAGQKKDPQILLQKFLDWTKPKSAADFR